MKRHRMLLLSVLLACLAAPLVPAAQDEARAVLPAEPGADVDLALLTCDAGGAEAPAGCDGAPEAVAADLDRSGGESGSGTQESSSCAVYWSVTSRCELVGTTFCGTCGDGLCELGEACRSSLCTCVGDEPSEGIHCTQDCGPLFCAQDCG